MSLLEKEKKSSQIVTPLFFGIMIASIATYVVIYAIPVIGELPVEITEEMEIVGITEKGIAVETSLVSQSQQVNMVGK